jgi:hypothetical protein
MKPIAVFFLVFLGCMRVEEKSTTQESSMLDDALPSEVRLATLSGYDPVCGSDGNTYENARVAKQLGITSYSPGECCRVVVSDEAARKYNFSTLKRGDMNYNGTVDTTDLAILRNALSNAQSYGAEFGVSADIAGDMNENCQIDEGDAKLLAARLGVP